MWSKQLKVFLVYSWIVIYPFFIEYNWVVWPRCRHFIHCFTEELNHTQEVGNVAKFSQMPALLVIRIRCPTTSQSIVYSRLCYLFFVIVPLLIKLWLGKPWNERKFLLKDISLSWNMWNRTLTNAAQRCVANVNNAVYAKTFR